MGPPGDDGPSPDQSRLVLDDGQFGQTEKGYTPGGEVGVDDVFTNPCSGG